MASRGRKITGFTYFKNSIREVNKPALNTSPIDEDSQTSSEIKLYAIEITTIEADPQRKSLPASYKILEIWTDVGARLNDDYVDYSKNLITGLPLPWDKTARCDQFAKKASTKNMRIECELWVRTAVQIEQSAYPFDLNKLEITPLKPEIMDKKMNECLTNLQLNAHRYVAEESAPKMVEKVRIDYFKAEDFDNRKYRVVVKYFYAPGDMRMESKTQNSRGTQSPEKRYLVLCNVDPDINDLPAPFLSSHGRTIQAEENDNAVKTEVCSQHIQAGDSQRTTAFPGWSEAYANLTKCLFK